jgi:hypothetical protein
VGRINSGETACVARPRPPCPPHNAPSHHPQLGVGTPQTRWRGCSQVPRPSHHPGPIRTRPSPSPSPRIPRSHDTEPVTDPTLTRSRILALSIRSPSPACRPNHPRNTPHSRGWPNSLLATTSSTQSETPSSSSPQNSPLAPGPVAA